MSLIRNTLILMAGCASGLAVGPLGRSISAQEPPPQTDASRAPGISKIEISQLIEDLGSPQYSIRERASSRILALGEVTLEQLAAVEPTAPLELRQRAGALLSRIRVDTFEGTAREFLTNSDPAESYGLPAWETFRQCVGSSRTSKLLFLDAVRCQEPLLTGIQEYVSAIAQQAAAKTLPSVEVGPATAARLQEEATRLQEAVVLKQGIVQHLGSQMATQLQLQQRMSSPTRLGDFVALLLVAASIDTQTPVVISETLETNIHRYGFTGFLQKQGYGTCLRRLMSAWVPKTHDALGLRIMQIALQYDIASAKTVARKHLKANSDLLTRCAALQCLARFGDETDVDRIQELLTDHELLHSLREDDLSFSDAPDIDESYSAPPGFEGEVAPPGKRMFVVHVSDLALVAAVKLSGGEPTEYFPNLRENGPLGIDTRSLATPAEEQPLQRQRIERWLATRDAQLADG